MAQKDPFATDPGIESTVVRPTPGGRRGGAAGAAPPSAPPPRPRLPSGPPVALPQSGINPLVTAASPLLGLASRLKHAVRAPDVAGLHDRVKEELRRFRERASSAGVSPQVIDQAHFALCALIDDVVQNTPWGLESRWAQRSMVDTFHKTSSGGDDFFVILERRKREPGNHIDLLELMYLCLALGFEGRFRLQPRGASDLTRIRDDLYRIIRNLRGDFERELSPHWQGVDAGHRPLASYIPVWVVGAASAALLVAMYMAYYFLLNGSADALIARLGTLRPQLAIAERGPPMPPPVLPNDQLARVEGFLEPEIRAGLVEVFPGANSLTVRLTAPTMFASASDALQDQYLGLLGRIGEALNNEPGRVLVVGHTDNVPIRRSLRFASNYDLSLARAEAVRAILASRLNDPGRLTSEGRADTEPIAPNDTAENRGRNRRVEVILIRPVGTAA